MRTRLLMGMLMAVVAVGCAGSRAPLAGGPRHEAAPRAPEAASTPGSWSSAKSDAPATGGALGDGAPSTTPSERGAESAAPRDEERPGLGTSWGETRESRVSSAPFDRADPDRPFAVASLFYNDERGIRAMSQRESGARWGDALARTAWNSLAVRLVDGSGNPLRGLETGSRSYVVGEDGARYTIQIRNDTGNRVEVVASVDGLDVIDGTAASFTKRGYILQPFSTIEIDGFRRSMDEVAAFRFGKVGESYATSKSEARNVGVIGVAFFAEESSRWPWTDREVDRRHDADPFPGRFATPPRSQW